MWQIATFEDDNQTQFVSRENVAEMDRAELLDYIMQLESVIAQLKFDKEGLERLIGVK